MRCRGILSALSVASTGLAKRLTDARPCCYERVLEESDVAGGCELQWTGALPELIEKMRFPGREYLLLIPLDRVAGFHMLQLKLVLQVF